MTKQILFYFGADDIFPMLIERGYRRRNAYILKELSRFSKFQIYSVHRTYFKKWWRLFRKEEKGYKYQVKDVFIASLFPDTFPLFRTLNNMIFRLQLRLQVETLGDFAVWAYWPRAFKLSQRVFPGVPVIFDLDHNIINDPNQNDSSLEIENIIQKAHYNKTFFIAASQSMLYHLQDLNKKNLYRLRNGSPGPKSIRSCSERRNIHVNQNAEQLTIGYVGMFSKWIKFELFKEIVLQFPEHRFEVVGSVAYEGEDNFEALPNLHFLGFQEANVLPKIFAKWDVALGLYEPAEWNDADSMKLYDYLNAGLPVLSTPYYTDMERDFNNLIFTFTNLNEFQAALLKLGDKTDEEWEDWQNRREYFLKNSTWERRLENFYPILENFLNGK